MLFFLSLFFSVRTAAYAHYAVMTVGTCEVYKGCRLNKIFYVEWKKVESPEREKCCVYTLSFSANWKKGISYSVNEWNEFRNERRKLMQGKKHSRQRALRLLGYSNQVEPVRTHIFHFLLQLQLDLEHFLVSAALNLLGLSFFLSKSRNKSHFHRDDIKWSRNCSVVVHSLQIWHDFLKALFVRCKYEPQTEKIGAHFEGISKIIINLWASRIFAISYLNECNALYNLTALFYIYIPFFRKNVLNLKTSQFEIQ